LVFFLLISANDRPSINLMSMMPSQSTAVTDNLGGKEMNSISNSFVMPQEARKNKNGITKSIREKTGTYDLFIVFDFKI